MVEVVGDDEVNDIVLPGTYVAVRAPENKNSMDVVWFIEVEEVNRVVVVEKSIDDYQHEIAAGIKHNVGYFLERDARLSNLKATYFKRSSKKTYFFKESILYPCVNILETKKGLSLSMGDYTEVLNYIEEHGFTHL